MKKNYCCEDFLENLESSIKINFEQLCFDEDYDGIKLFLNNFKYLNLASCDNSEFFSIVAEKGNLELMKLFVEFGADVHDCNNYFLANIAYHEYDDCLEYLLDVHKMDIETIKYKCGYSYAQNFIIRRLISE